ncbi:transposase [Paenibacillus sp.]|uniref:transposase n=1 Tax=Paenibacillus sp. TaxID=58172 RepID=UPI0039C9A8FC
MHGFRVGGNESAHGWKEFLQELYQRGAREILLGVFEGLVGLEEAFHSVYLKADVQRCLVHRCVLRFPRFESEVKVEFMGDFKNVYNELCYEEAVRQFQAVELKLSKQYPRLPASRFTGTAHLLKVSGRHLEIDLHHQCYRTNGEGNP